MNFRVRHSSPIRFSIATLLLVYIGACRPPAPSGGQASTSESPAGRGVTSTPFADGEVWILSSDTTTGQSGLAYPTISGAGNLISSIDVTTDVFTNDVCRIQSPDSAFGPFPFETPSNSSIEFEFDGASMRVSASSQGTRTSFGHSWSMSVSPATAQSPLVLSSSKRISVASGDELE